MKTERKQSRIGHIFSSIFKFRAWIDYDRIKEYSIYLATGIKKMTVPSPVKVKDKDQTFTDAVKKLDLKEEELKKRAKGLYRLSLLMVTVAVLFFGYFLYQLFFLHIKAMVMSFVLVAMALTLAFRYHFWYYQIKEHRLGCTFKEWYYKGFLAKKEKK